MDPKKHVAFVWRLLLLSGAGVYLAMETENTHRTQYKHRRPSAEHQETRMWEPSVQAWTYASAQSSPPDFPTKCIEVPMQALGSLVDDRPRTGANSHHRAREDRITFVAWW
jgi:hypothetical protein